MGTRRRGGEGLSAGISMVIATRDRHDQVERCLESILRCARADLRIIVVDQSRRESGASPAGLESTVWEDRRVERILDPGVGLSRAHNLGIAAASTEIVVLTDDDCEVPVDHLDAVEAAFRDRPAAAVIFGNVVPAEHDPSRGLIPGYVRSDELIASGPNDAARLGGLGACMAVRRRTWFELGGFDVMLGAGARFRAGNEGDFARRALAAGKCVLETHRVSVVHHGFRDLEGERHLLWGYGLGTGAMLAKHSRIASPGTTNTLSVYARRWLLGSRDSALRLGPRLHPSLRLAAFLRGFGAGLLAPVDRVNQRFVPDRQGTTLP